MNDFGPGIALPLIAAVVGLAFILHGPIGKALARRLEGRGVADGLTPGELEELRGRVAESDELRARVAELEERLDFAERLIAQQREPGRIEN